MENNLNGKYHVKHFTIDCDLLKQIAFIYIYIFIKCFNNIII